MNITLRIWRQPGPGRPGRMVAHHVEDVSPDMSFLEVLDVLNQRLITAGEDHPVAFDSDCREGICGMCGLVINGIPHGPQAGVTTCQLHMRTFADGEVIDVEPWRAGPFPVLKDLVVDRGALDRIIEASGYISIPTGSAPEAHSILVPNNAEDAFDAATCIGCGACVAACPNGSAALFLGAKITHLGLLPQGQPERDSRALAMIARHDAEGFGGCTQIGECTAVCPKDIQLDAISRCHRDVLTALFHHGKQQEGPPADQTGSELARGTAGD